MNKKDKILMVIDKDIESLQKEYDSLEKTSKDFVNLGILLGKINGLLTAKQYILLIED